MPKIEKVEMELTKHPTPGELLLAHHEIVGLAASEKKPVQVCARFGLADVENPTGPFDGYQLDPASGDFCLAAYNPDGFRDYGALRGAAEKLGLELKTDDLCDLGLAGVFAASKYRGFNKRMAGYEGKGAEVRALNALYVDALTEATGIRQQFVADDLERAVGSIVLMPRRPRTELINLVVGGEGPEVQYTFFLRGNGTGQHITPSDLACNRIYLVGREDPSKLKPSFDYQDGFFQRAQWCVPVLVPGFEGLSERAIGRSRNFPTPMDSLCYAGVDETPPAPGAEGPNHVYLVADYRDGYRTFGWKMARIISDALGVQLK